MFTEKSSMECSRKLASDLNDVKHVVPHLVKGRDGFHVSQLRRLVESELFTGTQRKTRIGKKDSSWF